MTASTAWRLSVAASVGGQYLQFADLAFLDEAQAVLTWLPMIHGVEYLREGFFGSQITAIYDLGYMAVCNAVLTLLGLALIRIVSESVIPE